ncbi:alpha-1,3-mannosyltransferase ALG2 (macronuclear) [Tetrahymena thermophila SB210]|uniref:Alpha-1,3/1,6-mannosyltransferase ALG2 n=1 Tax=Tetrahymena thermophila (strain SB210) TaxID=312017 RepID=I7LV68_TETTS|nr:alpha-1,3-mannosyltransferase ALG2 [Tetrahymena thermophila SB210]EAR97317.1 alpha-1,3-mannosyltransferase ALG2 [Tetrahymena thermophila SB210]|eukprot:XP_001017562.1 alpha-1,3-mannosyltransferase ALG2 [Tetrahymena thermophila SB210]
MSESKSQLRIGFIHPDLGIGGAEQLIVNMAVALKKQGHNVIIYTPYHDPKHCFQATIDGTIPVEVRGAIVPQTIFGKLWALCATIRVIFCTLYLICFGFKFDVVIVDQVSPAVPLLRLFNRKCLFYCHYPDKLLCVERRSILKKIYRFFLDYIEEFSLLFANKILVNSNFTREVYQRSFKYLSKYNNPEILYPAIDFSSFDDTIKQSAPVDSKASPFFLSLNRYERKKNINLAIQAFAQFVKESASNNQFKLIIAGGYDERIAENVEHHKELLSLAKELNVEDKVVFKFSISNKERTQLLQTAQAVLYTPENEHFGIVPVECMYMKRPVLACNSGGPKESVVDGETGFLLQSNPSDWSKKMDWIAKNPSKAAEMGQNGRKRAIEKFGLEAFAESIDKSVREICQPGSKKNN